MGNKTVSVILICSVIWMTESDCGSSNNGDIIFPKISKNYKDEQEVMIDLGAWKFKGRRDDSLLFSHINFHSEWILDDEKNESTSRKIAKCDHFSGQIQSLNLISTVAAVSVCSDAFFGYFTIDDDSYFFEPLSKAAEVHIMYQSGRNRDRRSTNFSKLDWIADLRGDTFDMSSEEIGETIPNVSSEDKEDFNEKYISESTEEEEGYFFDSAWNLLAKPKHNSINTNNTTVKYLEIAIGVDNSVVEFHGKDKVEVYVLALMNIVNAIYQDSSLDANIKLVIARLLLYESEQENVIKMGNAKKSLENVNSWNKKLHSNLKREQPRHDAAIWLTRIDIGGPSGYAPVAGVCDPKRSCALNKDEGLSSAFIIAHELAHILGLTHDGDIKLGNHCESDTAEGSVMAPMVSATFNNFYWSNCSNNELSMRLKNWTCLANTPTTVQEILLNSTLETVFDMNEQCRMEFGEGYSSCSSFDIIEPCSHLWCENEESPLVCKTKKGPPLEGTECGFGKWCMGGYCTDIMESDVYGRIPIVLNPQDGGWSEWEPWGSCSRTCGTGVQFRSRKCDNPKPSYGGKSCEGQTETWKICNVAECPEPYIDLKAEQCKTMSKLANISTSDDKGLWLPYENENEDSVCKISCINSDQNKKYFTDENWTDGTPCSYENSDYICVQGKCIKLGCDGVLGSNSTRDRCGVCGGNNSKCVEYNNTFNRELKKNISRIGVIPKLSREIRITADVNFLKNSINSSNIAFVLKRRRKKRFELIIPDSQALHKIISGAKFFYQETDSRFEIWTKGPVLSEIIILVIASDMKNKENMNMSFKIHYSINRDYLKPSPRYLWLMGGWGPCSKSCGGGKRQRTLTCYDKQGMKIVRKKFCALFHKPALQIQACNNFGCDFDWLEGPWEPCSSTCGTLGTQSREVYCVPNSLRFGQNYKAVLHEPWKFMVNPKHCNTVKLLDVRSCNRKPCFYYWEYGNWSHCSVTCGTGVSMRPSACPSHIQGACGESQPIQIKTCHGDKHSDLCKIKHPCLEDESRYCSVPELKRYCNLKEFKKICCKSCRIITKV